MDKLDAPADFVSSNLGKATQNDLMPPSHFTSCPRTNTSAGIPGSVGRGSPMTWATPGQEPAVEVGNANPWLAIAQAKQEILELRRTNQRLKDLRGSGSSAWAHGPGQELSSGMRSGDGGVQTPSCCFDSERRPETERLRAEVERLREKVDALKETTGRQREDIQKRDHTINRTNEELEELRADLCRTKTDLGQSRSEQERLGLELGRVKKQEEVLAREVERSTLEVQRRATEESCKLEVQTLRETERRLQTELQQLSTTHHAELSALRQTNADLQDKLSRATQEIDSRERCLQQASEEKDKLTEQLSQVGNAYEAQSTTLQRLRNYIGQLAPERQDDEILSATVQKLESQKEALEVTVELLTVRLTSLNDILVLQEKEMGDKILSDPLLKGRLKGGEVLRLWREKVFTSLVLLRSKDIELRGERSKFLTTLSALEQEVKKQTSQASVFQHSLQDRIAELDLERVRRETVQQELSRTLAENERQRTLSQGSGSALNSMVTAVQRFSLVFEDKVAEVQAAQRRLQSLSQRLTFAKGRVDTVQGLMMRKEALWKVQQASKPTDPGPERSSIDSLHTELALVCEERDSLVQELKRTPELIERSLSEARERFESELGLSRQLLQQSREKASEAEASLSQAEQRLQEAQRAVDERTESLEQLRAELVLQKEESERALQEKVSESEARGALRLRELEAQLHAVRREHTKAVVTLRQSERQAERDRERLRGELLLRDQQIQTERRESQKLLRATDKDRNLLLATVHESGLLAGYKRARTAPLHSSSGPGETSRDAPPPGDTPAPLAPDAFLSVLDELQTLSAAVMSSSEASSD